MTKLERITTNTISPDYVDGQILQHVDMNKIVDVFRKGINKNYEDIQDIVSGEKVVGNASSLNGLGAFTTDNGSLNNSDEKLPTSRVVKEYVDNKVNDAKPVKGVDYFTDGELAQITSTVENSVKQSISGDLEEETNNIKNTLNNYVNTLKTNANSEINSTYTSNKADIVSTTTSGIESINTAKNNAIDDISDYETSITNAKDDALEEIEDSVLEIENARNNAITLFGSNYDSKVDAFNSNYTSKLNSFNTNSTEKYNTFNSNANEKIEQLTELIEGLPTDLTSLKTEVVSSLPETGEIGTIYFVPNGETGNNTYTEYMWMSNNNKFEIIGVANGSTDLSGYYTSSQVDNKLKGYLVFNDSYVANMNKWLTNGYTKVSKSASTGHPSLCTGSDMWGILFFIAENAANGTGTQMYFPIDGTYKGRIFTRAIVNGTKSTPSIGSWELIPLSSDIPTKVSQLTNDSGFLTSNDYASYNTGGVVKSGNSFVTNSSGVASCGVDTYNDYTSKSNNAFISKGTLENVITGKELVSSSNLKTINGNSILGSGNIVLEGSSGSEYNAGYGISISDGTISVDNDKMDDIIKKHFLGAYLDDVEEIPSSNLVANELKIKEMVYDFVYKAYTGTIFEGDETKHSKYLVYNAQAFNGVFDLEVQDLKTHLDKGDMLFIEMEAYKETDDDITYIYVYLTFSVFDKYYKLRCYDCYELESNVDDNGYLAETPETMIFTVWSGSNRMETTSLDLISSRMIDGNHKFVLSNTTYTGSNASEPYGNMRLVFEIPNVTYYTSDYNMTIYINNEGYSNFSGEVILSDEGFYVLGKCESGSGDV